MKDVTEIKSLSDIRTAASHHIASKPPLKGSTHLDLYLLDKEKQRLEKERSRLEQRQRRIQERLTEIHQAMDKLDEAAQQEKSARRSVPAKSPIGQEEASRKRHQGCRWRKVAISY
ncbi:MAG: hypothetical protein HY664_08510 [Chloroflexi bacterium]|nr:hypothetical protein [Chloroflexota bacterium]